MLGKSRHVRGKRSFQSKKRRSRRSHQATVSQQKTVAQSDKPATVPPEVITPSLSASAITPATLKHPNLPYELRRIGILAVIMLAALIMLALVLD